MRITIVGLGYVGSALAVLLSKKNPVIALDVNEERVNAIRERRSPVGNALMEAMLQKEQHLLSASTDPEEAFSDAEYIIVSTNTQLDPETGELNTRSVENVVENVASCRGKQGGGATEGDPASDAPVIVIRSTVPTGFTKELSERYPQFPFLFCPEFLREKTAMEDVLHPSRIIIGSDAGMAEDARAQRFAEILLHCIEDPETPLLFTSTEEAEAIKLFANSYLALRIAFFNELDSFASAHGLDTARMIKGVCLDPRIGDWYNTPGPGFGGTCLPKDTRQLIADFKDLPELLIRAALEENELRKKSMER